MARLRPPVRGNKKAGRPVWDTRPNTDFQSKVRNSVLSSVGLAMTAHPVLAYPVLSTFARPILPPPLHAHPRLFACHRLIRSRPLPIRSRPLPSYPILS